MLEEHYRKWLPDNNVTGRTVGDYISYLNAIEKKLGDVDVLLKSGLEKTLERINSSNFPDKAKRTLGNYRSSLSKYYVFRNS